MLRAEAIALLDELRQPTGPGAGLAPQAAGGQMAGGMARPTFGIGLSHGADAHSFRIAVRVQDQALVGSARVQAVVDLANGQADVEFIGRIAAFSSIAIEQAPTARVRPLAPGCSISSGTANDAGTLGCFVRDDDGVYLLSNNHVLTPDGKTTDGLPVVQPGRHDGGDHPGDTVGSVTRTIGLDSAVPNAVDCAIAALDDPDVSNDVPGVGPMSSDVVEPEHRDAVIKRGRSSGVTAGEVVASKLDLHVQFAHGQYVLTDLVEISGREAAVPFAELGDSGSVIVRSPDRAPLALLVAGARDSSGVVRVYATPMSTVLDKLSVTMV